jgi:hypothetical protein
MCIATSQLAVAHNVRTYACCGQVKYDQDGNIVLREMRDYLGALTDVERVDRNGRPLPGVTDAELAVMQVGLAVGQFGSGSCCLSQRPPLLSTHAVLRLLEARRGVWAGAQPGMLGFCTLCDMCTGPGRGECRRSAV